MAPQRMRDFESVALCPCVTRFGLGRGRNDKAQMVQRLLCAVARIAPMERKVVASRAHVDVVRVGLPYHPHAEYPRIKFARARDVADRQREMAKSAMLDHDDWSSPIFTA